MVDVAQSEFTPTDDELTSKISLSFAAKNLLDRDVFSKSDPICVVFLSTGVLQDDSYREFGRTEIIRNCLNPEWNERIEVDYFFEEIQRIKFEIYDIDSRSSKLSEHDFLGGVETTLAEIVGAPFSQCSFKLSNIRGRKQRGELIVCAEEVSDYGKEKVEFVCKGLKLDKKDLFGKSDPFLKIYKNNNDSSLQLAYRTEVVKKTVNPEWKPFSISVHHLCGNDRQRLIRFECYDYDKNGGHDFIGSCETTLDRLLHKNDKELPLINEKKRKKKGEKYKNSGHLLFTTVTAYYEYSFLDYIAGGTQLDFFVAIDMTASNGRITDPSSLHFIGTEQPNEYHIAISAVAEICQHYNNTKTFLAAGFGAKLSNQKRVSHCFPLDLSTGSYFVQGVEGLLQAYRCCLMNCTLHGPTNFAPVIDEAAKRAALYPRNGSRYQILLIITDGCITDFCQTLNAIIAASYLPLSIIIVGVGGENFENMYKLDSDSELLQYQGRTAQRDIVQFVSLREFLNGKGVVQPISQSVSAMAHLAKEVLAEVPHQLTSYMKLNGIKPRPANDSIFAESLSTFSGGGRLSCTATNQSPQGVISAPATPSFRSHHQKPNVLAARRPSTDNAYMVPPTGSLYPNLYPLTTVPVCTFQHIHPVSLCTVQPVQNASPSQPFYSMVPQVLNSQIDTDLIVQPGLYQCMYPAGSSDAKMAMEPSAPPSESLSSDKM